MVGVEGIEPSTFCSQSRRAKPLRYTPMVFYNTPVSHKKQLENAESFSAVVQLPGIRTGNGRISWRAEEKSNGKCDSVHTIAGIFALSIV